MLYIAYIEFDIAGWGINIAAQHLFRPIVFSFSFLPPTSALSFHPFSPYKKHQKTRGFDKLKTKSLFQKNRGAILP